METYEANPTYIILKTTKKRYTTCRTTAEPKIGLYKSICPNIEEGGWIRATCLSPTYYNKTPKLEPKTGHITTIEWKSCELKPSNISLRTTKSC